MNIAKKASLAVSVISAMYLTQCQSLPQDAQVSPLAKNTEHSYPHTRTQSDKQDKFKSGEFGRSSGLVADNLNARTQTVRNERAMPDDGIDTYFGEKVVDKYRWLEEVDIISPEYQREISEHRERNFIGTRLENDRPNGQLDNRTTISLQQVDDNAPKSEVTAWVDAQQNTTMQYINAIDTLPAIAKNVASLQDYEHSIRKVKTDKAGELHLYRGTDGYQRVVRTDKKGNTHELWREKELEWGLRNATGDFYVSKNGSYFALFLSTGGADSDKVSLHIFDGLTGRPIIKPKAIGTQIDESFLGAIWQDDDTLLYTNRLSPSGIHRFDVGAKRLNDPIEIRYSEIGMYASSSPWFTGKDDRYMVISGGLSTPVDAFFIKDMKTGKIYRPFDQKLVDKKRDYPQFVIVAKFVHFDDETGDLWLVSGENDDQRGEIIKTNLHNLKKREVVVPVNLNYDYISEAIYHKEGNGYFVINYKKDGQARVVVTDATGKVLKDITPSEVAAVDNLFSVVAGEKSASNKAASEEQDKDDKQESYISFRFHNFGTPRTVYKYSIAKDEFIDVRRRDLFPFDHNQYESKLVKFKSKDGTEVPMSITYKKGTILNGKNPTMMLGYGGFAVPTDTYFTLRPAVWLEHGGVYANVHLRGGNEYAEKWHDQGRLNNKLNVFDDFEAAGDYLHQQGYTSPEYLMITGGSNGGLLVGAAMTLAPHKYRVAIPAVGVLDMARHDQKYFIGRWDGEYGSIYDTKEMADILKAYSPYHNIKAGVCYPATLVTTAKRDDRVLPYHSYKFAAALQENQGCNNPTYLFVDEAQGHGQRTPRQRKDYAAITTAFALNAMGINQLPSVTRPTVEELKGEKWLKEEAEEKAKQAAEQAK